MKRFYILIILILILFFPLIAENSHNFHFKKITVDDGLSESSVYCILQDKKGFMWFGTKDGLNKYDGSSFHIYRGIQNAPSNKQTLQNNFVRSMIQSNDSIMYIGTDIGLYSMNMNTENFSFFNLSTADGDKITSAVNTLLINKENDQLWIGTMFQGVFVYDLHENILTQVEVHNHKLSSNAVWTIYKDKSNVIWVGTRIGLLRYDKTTEKLVPIKDMFSNRNISGLEILSIYEDDNGNLWLGTWDGGLRRYNKQSNEYKSFLNDKNESCYVTHIRSIFHYVDDFLFVGSDDGLYLFNIKTYEAERLDTPFLGYGLSDQNVYSIAKDKEGGVWIGTYFGGVNYLPPFPSNMEVYQPSLSLYSLSGKAISQFCEDKQGNLWIATEDGGVNYLNTQTKKITQPIKTSYHNTHALLLDNDDLWIGTFSRGINVYNTKNGQLSSFRFNSNDKTTLNDDCVFSLYKTKSGDIYVGTTVGLNKYDRQSGGFSRITEARGFVYDIKEDDYGNLWVATYGSGVKKLNIKQNEWISYDSIFTSDDLITSSKLTSIYIDSQKRLFFTSEGRGLFLYNYQTNSFQNISEADGLPNNIVYGVLDDSYGNLWISSNKGLACMNNDLTKIIKTYNQDDGLQSNQFNFKASYKSLNGKMYFGGVNGFNSFYPKDLYKNENLVIPSVEITTIKLFDQDETTLERELRISLKRNKQIEIPVDKASFSISYIALSYISETNNQYAYKLKGVDSDWNYVGNTKTVTYVNLPSGNYVFQIKASNNDGVWNEKGVSLNIIIPPPFWLTNTAKIFYLLITIALIFVIVWFYHKKSIRKQEKILEIYRSEQETLAFKSKIDFFTTIAHEIRTPLSLINAPLEEIIISGDGVESTKQNLSIIEQNCSRLNTLIKQLLDFRKMDSRKYIVNPEKVDLTKFLQDLFDRFKKTANQKGIDLQIQLPEKEAQLMTDSDALTKIVGNLLTNAMKYTKDKISLKLVSEAEGQYEIYVEDNGVGIADGHKSLVFEPFYQIRREDQDAGSGIGLSLVKHLSEALNGSIDVYDAKPHGTIFVFKFSNIENQHYSQKVEEVALDENLISSTDKRNSILIVDDNPEIISYLKKSLEKDYYVGKAYNADEAFAVLNGERLYDLIISDIMMPEIDGISFTRSIKSDLNYSHIPVILLSAKTENITKIEGLQSGADVFIEKPFSIIYLKAQIESLLENRENLRKAFSRTPFSTYASLITNKKDEEFFKKLDSEIEYNISDETFTIESLADTLGMSRSNLQRKLRSICGMTPGDYLRDYRLKRASKLLLEEDMRVNEVAFSVGFNSASYFTKVFKKVYQMSPTEFLNKYKS